MTTYKATIEIIGTDDDDDSMNVDIHLAMDPPMDNDTPVWAYYAAMKAVVAARDALENAGDDEDGDIDHLGEYEDTDESTLEDSEWTDDDFGTDEEIPETHWCPLKKTEKKRSEGDDDDDPNFPGSYPI